MPQWVLDHVVIVGLVTAVLVSVLVVAVLKYFQPPRNPAFAGPIVSIILTVSFGFGLHYLLTLEGRFWTLRQQHLERLRPVLATEANTSKWLAEQLRNRGYVMDLTAQPEAIRAGEQSTWAPNVMTGHLREHFGEYYEKREALRAELNLQDEQFRDALLLVENQVRSFDPGRSWKRWISLAVLEKCMDKGPGLTLVVSGDYFSYRTPGGGSGGGSGKPSREQLSAVRAFQAFKPSAELLPRCRTLRQRAESLESRFKELYREALTLTEETSLKGSCYFLKLD